ncbi:hypothetical protein C2S51_032635 [Perilla frutescens var. frutescens]|nr:hypothetical protein C2S51_032635 [Perilla frutescens var. frutescens]
MLLLQRAEECCPLHVNSWLAFARLETCGNARKVLNRAREKLCKELDVWMATTMLEEANGNSDMVGKIIERGVRVSQRKGVEIDRELLMKEAEATERGGFDFVAKAIIHNTIVAKAKWLGGDVSAARAILEEAHATIPNCEEIWLVAYKLEFDNGEPERARMLLAKGSREGRIGEGVDRVCHC